MARARWQLNGPGGPSGGQGRGGMPLPDLRPSLRAQTLGASVLLIGNARLDPSAGTIFPIMLRVVYSPGFTISRDTLLRSVWPDQAESRSRASLRQSLYKLRGTGLEVGLDGEVVSLDPSQVTPVFATHRTHERFEQDVTCGHEPFGQFLPGYATGRALYDEWLTDLREQVHADVRRVLVEQLRTRRGRADWMGADALARWLLQFDPLNEEATLTRAECTALNGSKSEAVAIIDRFLAELGPDAGDLRLQATLVRRRISEPPGKQRVSFAPTERHFIGREALMADLTLAMRRAKWHDGSATLLHGPPGMGKTRVTQELSKVAVIEGFRVVSVSCRESDQQRPLSVFLDLVPELLEMPGAMGCAPESMQVLRRLTVQDTATSPDTLPLIEGSSDTLGSPAQRFPSPSEFRNAIVELYASLCFESPILFVVDDAHWIDESSWLVLRALSTASLSTKLYVLVASRELRTRELLRTATELIALPLRELSTTSCSELVDAICLDLHTELPVTLKRWFVSASEGIPLFLRSLLNHWIETGEAGGIPPTLSMIMSQRLGSLSEDALRVTQIATLLGRHATVETVGSISELSTLRMVAALDELLAVGAYTSTASSLIQFHELFARAAIETFSPHSRRLVHARIAHALQEADANIDDSVVVDIVEHLKLADSRDELGEYASRCAESLLVRGLPHRALAVCASAAGFVQPGVAELSISKTRAQALHLAGHYSKLLTMHPTALSRSVHDASWDEQHVDELLAVLDSARHSEEFEDYAEFAARATLLAESSQLSAKHRVRAANVALRTATNVNLPELTGRALDAGLLAAAQCENSEFVQNELLMFYHTSFGRFDEGARAASWLADRTSHYRSDTVRIGMQAYIAFALRVNAAPMQAQTLYLRTFEEAKAAQMQSTAAYIAWNLSLIHFDWTGNAAEATHWISEAIAQCTSPDQQRCRTVVHQNEVRLEIVSANHERAMEKLKSMIACTPRSSIPVRRAYPLAMQLGVAVLSGSPNDVSPILDEALDLHAQTRTMNGQDFFTEQIVRALLLVERRSDARTLLDEYVTCHRRHGPNAPNYLTQLAFMLRA